MVIDVYIVWHVCHTVQLQLQVPLAHDAQLVALQICSRACMLHAGMLQYTRISQWASNQQTTAACRALSHHGTCCCPRLLTSRHRLAALGGGLT